MTEPSLVVRKLLESSIVGNLGLTLPTGSDHIVYNCAVCTSVIANGRPEGLAFARDDDDVVVSTCTRERGTPVPGTSRLESLRQASENRAHRPSTESLGARCLPALKSTLFLRPSNLLVHMVLTIRN